MNPNISISNSRNPLITLSYKDKIFTIQTIGDPHLGRNYRNNQRHRLGDREDSIKETFISLLDVKVDLVVIMGDLFDKVSVTNEWYDFTIKALEEASKNNPYTTYVVLNGNHDLTKDKDRISSFELLSNYFESYKGNNLIFISDNCSNSYLKDFNTTICFTNYDPFNSIDNLVTTKDLFYIEDSFKIVFGHFEVESFSSDKFIDREIPSILLDNFNLIVTGHIHTPSITKVKGVDVLVTGSMQPYAFGEQIKEDGILYIEILLSELKSILETNPDHFINSNVRVLYNKDDELISPFNCYSYSYKLIPTVKNLEQIQNIKTESISFSDLFLRALEQRKTEENISFVTLIEKDFLEKNYESN